MTWVLEPEISATVLLPTSGICPRAWDMAISHHSPHPGPPSFAGRWVQAYGMDEQRSGLRSRPESESRLHLSAAGTVPRLSEPQFPHPHMGMIMAAREVAVRMRMSLHRARPRPLSCPLPFPCPPRHAPWGAWPLPQTHRWHSRPRPLHSHSPSPHHSATRRAHTCGWWVHSSTSLQDTPAWLWRDTCAWLHRGGTQGTAPTCSTGFTEVRHRARRQPVLLPDSSHPARGLGNLTGPSCPLSQCLCLRCPHVPPRTF